MSSSPNRKARRAHDRQHRRDDRRRRRLADLGHEHWVSMMPAWCATADDLPDARQQTHDALIELLGSARRSGVRWRQVNGDDAVTLLNHLASGQDSRPEWLDLIRRLRGMLREYGGWIVVAEADAARR